MVQTHIHRSTCGAGEIEMQELTRLLCRLAGDVISVSRLPCCIPIYLHANKRQLCVVGLFLYRLWRQTLIRFCIQLVLSQSPLKSCRSLQSKSNLLVKGSHCVADWYWARRAKCLDHGNNVILWLGSNSRLTGMMLNPLPV